MTASKPLLGATIAVAMIAMMAALACAPEPPAPPVPELHDVEARVRDKITRARAAVEGDPRNAATWGRYGMALDAHRLPREAAPAYREASRLDPSEARWPYYLAALLQYSDPSEATTLYQRAIELDPSYGPAHVRLAQTLETLGRDQAARVEYRRAVELDPGNPRAHLGLGQLALARGELEEAVAHLERAYQLGPGIQPVVATLARAYRMTGREELARVRADEARGLPRRAQNPDPLRALVDDEAVDTESYLARAHTYTDVGQLERARRELESLLALEPDLARAWFAAAGVYDRLGEAELALQAASRALAIDQDLQGARAVVAGALFKLGRFAEAEPHVREVLSQEPDNLHMLLLTGMMAGQRGDFTSVVESLDRAFAARTRDRKLGPLLSQLLTEVAAAYAESGKLALASSRMEQAITVAAESGAGPDVIDRYRTRLDAYRAGRRQ